ncbi:MAG: type II toxin-antitoxin system RelE/ParE family toxin [Acidimicrobiia bacterium]
MASVRIIAAALEDLRRLDRKDPQIVRQVLKKCLLLERDPHAGRPLMGALVGYRKLVIANRHWRLVWRVLEDGGVEIAEVWAAGSRADNEIYDEIKRRVSEIGDHPLSYALDQIVELLASNSGIEASPEPVTDPIPRWLRDRLVFTAGIRPDRIDGMTGEEAMALWENYLAGG